MGVSQQELGERWGIFAGMRMHVRVLLYANSRVSLDSAPDPGFPVHCRDLRFYPGVEPRIGCHGRRWERLILVDRRLRGWSLIAMSGFVKMIS